MAILTCIYCQAENAEGEQLCRECFRKLPTAPLQPADTPPSPPDPATASPATASPATADPATAAPAGPAAAESIADPASDAGLDPAAETPATCPHCGEEVPDPRNRVCVECHRPLHRAEPLRLSFPFGDVRVDAAQSVQLGRDPTSSPVAALFADRDNVSRLHATVGVDHSGAWVRDEKSLNGTYVNDVPVPPDTRIELADGDTLRLAADVTATVRIISRETQWREPE